MASGLPIEVRWARGDITRYPKLARELIDRSPSVIVAACGRSLRAIRELSRTVPVVAMCADEKNFLGEVASLRRPGGHTTGVTFLSPKSVSKRLELLKAVVPGLSRLADSVRAGTHPHRFALARAGAPAVRLRALLPAIAGGAGRRARDRLRCSGARRGAGSSGLSDEPHGRPAEHPELPKHRVPSVFVRSPCGAGGLFSYGGSVDEWYGKSMPQYVDKILEAPGREIFPSSSRYDSNWW